MMRRPYRPLGEEGPVEHRPRSYFSCQGCMHYGSEMKLRAHHKSEDYHYCCHPKFGDNPEMVANGGTPYAPKWCPVTLERGATQVVKE